MLVASSYARKLSFIPELITINTILNTITGQNIPDHNGDEMTFTSAVDAARWADHLNEIRTGQLATV
jgi:hypothetical protein